MLGETIAHYRILEKLGQGGMGEVYRARDTRLLRDVALKVLSSTARTDPERLSRLEREARIVAGLNHPNIVVLHSVEESGGTLFLTMELVEGQGLDQLIAAGEVPIVRALDLMIQLAEALTAAHDRGVIHRDLKPSNLMVSAEGRLKVLDFGLAKFAAGETDAHGLGRTAPLTMTGELMGTVPYMAPEQLLGEKTDSHTDLFAFGILLYELSTGHRPFRGSTMAEVSSAILRDEPVPATSLRPELPPELVRVLRRCLEKDPDRRIQTARDLRADLEIIRASVQGASRVPAPSEVIELATVAHDSSVAVLPFVSRGRTEEDEFFADGMTEDVIAQLAKLRTLKVISRRSVMAFKNHEQDLESIASQLAVAHVLEGSIRRIEGRVRIVAQLIDVRSGQHIWAETYDRQLADIFEIQAEVALHIASALKTELSPHEHQRIGGGHTQDMQAYDEYLRGRHLLSLYTIESLRASVGHFEAAIDRDPRFAPAHVGVVMALTDLMENGVLKRSVGGPRALSFAKRALALDPDLGEAHCALAYVKTVAEFDYDAAREGFKKALELSPGSADTYDLFGRMCSGEERFDEAIALLRRAFELDPLTHRSDLATVYLRAGRSAEAERLAAEALELDPRYPRLHATHGWALLKLGRVEEGLEELEHAVSLAPEENMWLAQFGQALAIAGKTEEAQRVLQKLQDPQRSIPASPYHLAYVHTGLGELERAVDCLELAFEEGTGALSTLQGSFLFTPLREHPRFQRLLERMRRS